MFIRRPPFVSNKKKQERSWEIPGRIPSSPADLQEEFPEDLQGE
jgi:hypothetical protein